MSYFVPANVIIIWTGTNASIPAGWERVTALDGRYLKGTADATEPNVTGGNAQHSHSATANHSHTMNAHTHSLSAGASYGDQEGTALSSNGTIQTGHTHTGSTNSTTGGGLSDVASTYALVDNDPPFYTVIYIKSLGTKTGIPNLGVVLSDDATFANNTGKWSNFYKCDGNNSTPNLSDKYLKGAGTGGNAGATGGSLTNVHTLAHTHTVASHSHGGVLNASSANRRDGDADSTENPNHNHTHTITTNAVTDTLNASPALTTAETVEPAYTKLMPVQNRASIPLLPVGTIAMWLGNLADIPTGWTLCDGTDGTPDMRDQYLKCTVTGANIGDTGGANTHTHASQEHTHTPTGTHSHSFTITHSTLGSLDRGSTTAEVFIDRNGASHDVTSDAITSVWANASTAGDEQSNEPLYITVAFMKLLYKPVTPSTFLALFVDNIK